MGALADCELIRHELLGQPVNTLTTLAFLVGGVWLLRRRASRWVGIALMATGLGSLVFHGPMPSWGEWAHDVTLAWLITVIGGLNTRWEAWARVPALVGLGTLFAIVPAAADPVAVALAVLVVGAILIRRLRRAELYPLVLLGIVAILGRMGATGGPLCDPASPWQLHGLWHLGAAAAVTWWTAIATDETQTGLPQP